MREINYTPPSSSSVFRLGTVLLVGLVAIYVVFASWYTVDQGEAATALPLGLAAVLDRRDPAPLAQRVEQRLPGRELDSDRPAIQHEANGASHRRRPPPR